MRWSKSTVAACAVFAIAPVYVSSMAAQAGTSHDARAGPDRYYVQACGQPSSKALPDTFFLYGGPHSLQGKFETSAGLPDRQGWTGVDLTQATPSWRITTYNPHEPAKGSTNHALTLVFAQRPPKDPSTASLSSSTEHDVDWWRPVPDPNRPTSVSISFDLYFKAVPEWPGFEVQWDSAGTIKTARTTPASPIEDNDRCEVTHVTTAFDIPRCAYIGDQNDFIHLRLTAYDGTAEAPATEIDGKPQAILQIDNVAVALNGVQINTGTEASRVADFEGGNNGGWTISQTPFVGDFSKVITGFRDPDPCSENPTPAMSFIDDATPPTNGAGDSTGGSQSSTWTYGVPGGWVVNYTGGLSGGTKELANEVWSPEILWDDPTTTSDDFDVGSAILRLSVWQHFPSMNGIFWRWQVRSFDGTSWGPWSGDDWTDTFTAPLWVSSDFEIRHFLPLRPVKIQVALGVFDMAREWEVPGNDATPAPVFDNVAVLKVHGGAPEMVALRSQLFQDSFSNSGAIGSDPDAEASAVRFDCAWAINSNPGRTPIAGDSISVYVVPVVPGTSVAGAPALSFVLFGNPLFETTRQVPDGVTAIGRTNAGWTIYAGSLPALPGPAGRVRFPFDIPGDGPARKGPLGFSEPDEPRFFFPGDELHFFIEARDSAGDTSILPADTSGFSVMGGYDRIFTVRALPSLRQDPGGQIVQPGILVIDDSGSSHEREAAVRALSQNGFVEGMDFDVYMVQSPDSGAGNGIGTPGLHGATGNQLGGYRVILYTSGATWFDTLSDGSHGNGNDLRTLNEWSALSGERFIAYFGDKLARELYWTSSNSRSYLWDTMGVDYRGYNVADVIAGQVAPRVMPSGIVTGIFTTDYVSFGGCPGLEVFDYVVPSSGSGAVTGHFFSDSEGNGYMGVAASVWREYSVVAQGTTWRRVAVTFPYSFAAIRHGDMADGSGRSSRAVLLGELLHGFGLAAGANPTGLAPIQRRFALGQNFPNPFNARTRIVFELPELQRVRLLIFDLRGRLVRTLVDAELDAGVHATDFDGRDDGGISVASGVYVYRLETAEGKVKHRMALVR
jgi:hypothetical protein